MPRLVLIDNYDSFTWNLVQALEGLGARVEVVRSDAAPAAALLARGPDGLVVSPGPGAPEGAGASVAALAAAGRAGLPALGVCLGHQALAVAFGARIRRAARPRHGVPVAVRHDRAGLLADLPDPFEAMLYHSLVVDETTLPECLAVTARGPEGEVMGLRHRTLPLEGVQFHPESIGTPLGRRLLARFVAEAGAARPRAGGAESAA